MNDFPVTVTVVFDGTPQEVECKSATVDVEDGLVYLNDTFPMDRTAMMDGMTVSGEEYMMLSMEYVAGVEGPEERVNYA